jgi:hypothetical protein
MASNVNGPSAYAVAKKTDAILDSVPGLATGSKRCGCIRWLVATAQTPMFHRDASLRYLTDVHIPSLEWYAT